MRAHVALARAATGLAVVALAEMPFTAAAAAEDGAPPALVEVSQRSAAARAIIWPFTTSPYVWRECTKLDHYLERTPGTLNDCRVLRTVAISCSKNELGILDMLKAKALKRKADRILRAFLHHVDGHTPARACRKYRHIAADCVKRYTTDQPTEVLELAQQLKTQAAACAEGGDEGGEGLVSNRASAMPGLLQPEARKRQKVRVVSCKPEELEAEAERVEGWLLSKTRPVSAKRRHACGRLHHLSRYCFVQADGYHRIALSSTRLHQACEECLATAPTDPTPTSLKRRPLARDGGPEGSWREP